VIQIDFGGRVPKAITNEYTGSSLETLTRIQEFFLGQRPLDLWDEDDGKAIGEVLVKKMKKEKFRQEGVGAVEFRLGEAFKGKGLSAMGAK
jgi:hypothetical protein